MTVNDGLLENKKVEYRFVFKPSDVIGVGSFKGQCVASKEEAWGQLMLIVEYTKFLSVIPSLETLEIFGHLQSRIDRGSWEDVLESPA